MARVLRDRYDNRSGLGGRMAKLELTKEELEFIHQILLKVSVGIEGAHVLVALTNKIKKASEPGVKKKCQ